MLIGRHVGKHCATVLGAECLWNTKQAVDVVLTCVFVKICNGGDGWTESCGMVNVLI